MDLHLQGKRAIVTGGSRGIGLAVAKALAAEGASVAIAARDGDTLKSAAAEFPPQQTPLAVPVDTRDDLLVREMIDSVVDRFGGVDILVNAAADALSPGPGLQLADLLDDAVRDQLEVKLLGYLRCIRAAAPEIERGGWGRIVNVSGLAARTTGSLIGSVRNVSVAAMTKNLADELGPRGINVTVVHPGLTVTERNLAQLADAAGTEPNDLGAVAIPAPNVGIGRLVTAAEVATVIAFLCSPLSVALNGDAIVAGGGAVGPIFY